MGENIKNILLTGTSGFLGTHMRKHLYGCPNQWRIFSINSRDEFENFEEKFANQKIDIIIHAGFSIDFQESNTDDSSKNIENTRRVLSNSQLEPFHSEQYYINNSRDKLSFLQTK